MFRVSLVWKLSEERGRGEEGKYQGSKIGPERDKIQVVRLTAGPVFTVTEPEGLQRDCSQRNGSVMWKS